MRYPLSYGDISPGDGFIKMTCHTRVDGLPDGVHTGGPWLSPGGEVWKPLDCKPYANADFRVDTEEDICLEAMAGKPAFPRNWRVEESNGRRWLVRPKCYLVPQDTDVHFSVLEIEQGVRALNRAGWKLQDAIQVALDPDGKAFILDLSAAHKYESLGPLFCDEWDRIERWLRKLRFHRLAELRGRGKYLLIEWFLFPPPQFELLDYQERAKWVHVYASLKGPVRAKIPDAIFADAENGDSHKVRVWTWVVTPEPIDEELVKSLELSWAWSPMR